MLMKSKVKYLLADLGGELLTDVQYETILEAVIAANDYDDFKLIKMTLEEIE